MNIRKSPQAGTSGQPSLEELALINQLSQRTLAAEEVYTFGVRLCDNQVDRDGERFPLQTLEELAPMFLGKSGIFDHDWSAKGQAARIYRTQIVQEDGVLTAAGDTYCYLKGYAYMLRTPGCQDLIAEIEGGIKREVSVGCSVRRAVCSICGQDMPSAPTKRAGSMTVCCASRSCWTRPTHMSFPSWPCPPSPTPGSCRSISAPGIPAAPASWPGWVKNTWNSFGAT